ncbi:MAG: thymidine kinase [Oscillospiraceae bacterium]|nr:thymidine kinase [Oscillospiraceae bacterium]MBQ2998220.1 thymidine kinase [Oscillospiraceae bacterium]MBQ3237422.1 thymidine kinase [Oscillospiraceae bacterium]MBQ3561562.1 thymidine kinase [Oscillospiraceae bacterium]MBQ4118501.1 thymidine kinase [Oscillospiraceae bacterium]
MAKLYFKYGAMGSSKSAQALITKYNYEERGMKVWLIKPKTDTRDGQNILKSRIGLFAVADEIALTDSIKERFAEHSDCNVIIADEAQFLAPEQIDELRDIVDDMNIPVMCFGLRTDFITKLFPGSMRLFEVADSITEIKTICDCGAKATVNARMDDNGKIVTAGDQICIGGNDRYIAMCHKCWKKAIAEQK